MATISYDNGYSKTDLHANQPMYLPDGASSPPNETLQPPPPPYATQGQSPPFTIPPYPQSTPYVIQGTPQYLGAGSPYFVNSTPQHQQQQVVVMATQPVISPVVITPPVLQVSFVGAIVLSCFVYWFCGFFFGGIAFILASIGQSSAASGDTRGAIQLRNASYGLSIAGIVISVIVAAILIGVFVSAAKKTVYYSGSGYYRCYSYSYGYYYCK